MDRTWSMLLGLRTVQLPRAARIAPRTTSLSTLAPNMLAASQTLPQNQGKLCPLVPDGARHLRDAFSPTGLDSCPAHPPDLLPRRHAQRQTLPRSRSADFGARKPS
jgi:hypothetical protein